MVTRNFLSLILITLVLGFASAGVTAQSWGGIYTYHADLGRTAGGTKMNIDYKIALEDDADGIAEINAEGYMTSSKILANMRARGSSMELRFLSYPDGKLENEFGVKLYKEGDLLLTLTRVIRSGKVTYRATIGKYNSGLKGIVYFKKAR